MALFLVQFQGKRLCPLSGGDLSKLLEIGALRGQDPLYSYREKQWFYIDECAGFAKYYDETPRSERSALPSFTPPPLDSLKIITLTELREVIIEKEIPVERIVEVEVQKEVPTQIEKIVEREVPVEVRVEVEKIVEHFIEPDPNQYVEQSLHQEVVAKLSSEQALRESLDLQCEELHSKIQELNFKVSELSDSESAIKEAREKMAREKKRADALYFKTLDLKEEKLSLEIQLKETQKDEEDLWRKNAKLTEEYKIFDRENKALKLALERTSPEAMATNEIKLRKYGELENRLHLLSKESTEKDQLIKELGERLENSLGFNEESARAEIHAELKKEYSRRWQQEKQKQLEQVISQEQQIKERGLEKESELLQLIERLNTENAKLKEELSNSRKEQQEFTHKQEKGYQKLKGELEERLAREVSDYKELIKRRESEIERLASKTLELESENESLRLATQHEQDPSNSELFELQKKLASHKVEVSKYKKKLEEIVQLNKNLQAQLKQVRSEASSASDNTKRVSEIENELALQKNKRNVEAQAHHELQLKFKKASIQIQKYKQKLELAADIIDKLKDKSKVKNEEITKLRGEMEKLAEAPTQLLNMNEIGLEAKQSAPAGAIDEANQSEEELAKLIGDSFEVPNLPEWKIKTDEGIQGPYSYAEMLELKDQKLISDKTQIKKKAEGTWKSMRDFFELTTKVLTHRVNIDGEVITKYYIKRGSFRAPFYEVCSFDLGGNELRGHCTSLSIGGAFIELARIENADTLREKKIFVRFSGGGLTASFGVQAIIKNVSEARPKGIGVMFVELPDHGREAIIEYINNYLEKLGNSAA